jgi:hypothetical protein
VSPRTGWLLVLGCWAVLAVGFAEGVRTEIRTLDGIASVAGR